MANPIEAQIRDRITSFVYELDLLVRKGTLEALRGVLESSSGSAPARRGRPAGAKRGPGRPRGSSANVEAAAQAIVAHVQANDGQGVSEIASATQLALPTAKRAIIQLLEAGQISKTGQKRGTRYHAGGRKAGRVVRAAKRTKRGKRRGKKAKAA